MRIRIYQIDPDRDTEFLMFRNLEFFRKKMGQCIPAEIYECVFSGEVAAHNLEEIYTIFNLHHPADYKGRSLSVSDIVEILPPNENSGFYFCDSVGFAKVDFTCAE